MGALMKWCATPWERGAPAPRICFFNHKGHKEKYAKNTENLELETGKKELETRPYILILC